MRVLKFRAWCKSTNTYLIQEKENTQIKSLHGLISQLEFNERNYGDDIILEQFTGLQDKNGKEIYEGDIVRRLYIEPEYQTHYGPNIPLGKYTEQIDTNFEYKEKTVEWDENGLWNIAVEVYTDVQWLEYQKENGVDNVVMEEILDLFGLPEGAEGEAIEYLQDEGFEINSIEELVSAYTEFEITGNIHENDS